MKTCNTLQSKLKFIYFPGFSNLFDQCLLEMYNYFKDITKKFIIQILKIEKGNLMLDEIWQLSNQIRILIVSWNVLKYIVGFI